LGQTCNAAKPCAIGVWREDSAGGEEEIVRRRGRGWSLEQRPGEQNSNRISFTGMFNNLTATTATSNDAKMPPIDPPRQVLRSNIFEMAVAQDCKKEHE
jgi:hypothetical protein